jgi:hypothetical protein
MRFRAGGERSRFFVPHVNPFHSFLFANRIGDPVEGITADSVDPFPLRLGRECRRPKRLRFSLPR